MKKYKWLFVVLGLLSVGYLGYHFYIFPILFPVDKEIKQYVEESLVPIRTIDPDDVDFEDLRTLKASIGEASVVLLGEQDHGDAPTFLAKTRIIKFLHQQMGFDVLVFESDFYGLSRSWEYTKAGQAEINAYRHDIYPMWANCFECAELFRYLESTLGTDSELTVAGADPKPDLKFSEDNLLVELSGLIGEKRLLTDRENKQRFLEILEETMINQYNSKATADQKEFFLTMTEEMGEKIEEGSFWHQQLKGLRGFVLNAWDPLGSNNHRDTQMADNMMWLINQKFKGRKVIFWGSNSHIFKNFAQTSDYQKRAGSSDTTNMGTYLHRVLGEKMYVLGFTSHSGQAGRLYGQQFDINPPMPHHFEYWMNGLGASYGFVDFKHASFRGEPRGFWMKALLHMPNNLNWFNLFDGIFYIEEMYPCTEDQN